MHDPKSEVSELMEVRRWTPPGGMMNTEYVALPEPSTVADAIRSSKDQRGAVGTLNTIFLVGCAGAAHRRRSAGGACSCTRRQGARCAPWRWKR